MSDVWVCKPDGTIQCQANPPVALDEARKALAEIIGDKNILDQKKHWATVIAPCGAPTGALNAFRITKEGYEILSSGVVGPQGFEKCPDLNEEGAVRTSVGSKAAQPDPQRALSAGSQPVLIRELIGRPVRCYRLGDIITEDYIENRVNIVHVDNVIVDIWFG